MARVNPLSGGNYEDRLGELGMSYAVMREGLGAGHQARNLCDKSHSAKGAGGYYAYNGMITSLSRQYCEAGWRRHDIGGVLPLLENEESQILLGLTSGNSLTGLPLETPRSRYPKGEVTKKLVSKNKPPNMEPLFAEPVWSDSDEPFFAGYQYYLTLVYFDKIAHVIRCEVSLPQTQTAKGYVTSWYERVIIPPYEVDDDMPDDPNEGFGVDVHVSPR